MRTLRDSVMRILVWFRGNDLRLRDHAPLRYALDRGEAILLYVLEPNAWRLDPDAAHQHQLRYLRQAVESLRADIEQLGSRLLIAQGSPLDVLPWLVDGCHVDEIASQRQTHPAARQLAAELGQRLNVPLKLFDGETLIAPGTMRTSTGTPYSVFTPFSRAMFQQLELTRPLPRPTRLPSVPADVERFVVAATRQPKHATQFVTQLPASDAVGEPSEGGLEGGESNALSRLRKFLRGPAAEYATMRDRLAISGTSRLSADLRFGCVSPKQVWTAANAAIPEGASKARYLTQLLWREFAYSTLWDRPELLKEPFQKRFRGFPWRRDPASFHAWVDGRTGYPVVDAAARQLRTEGYVHNRARMIAASFLAKHLMIDFRLGEQHYLDWLVDGDAAQNDLGWQWSSGSGCDAQPYFRIFNPVTQAERFDPDGDYVRRYLPELSGLSGRYLHRPWTTPVLEQRAAGIHIGRDYPLPIVEQSAARNRFLAVAAEYFAKPPTSKGD